jgi:protein-tyrosine phosphatase
VKLLDRGLAHFVASDCHDPVKRPPRLDLARTYLRRRYSDEYADLLLEINPRSALWGHALDPGPMIAPKPAAAWYQFWS